ncbi:hypothetical protein [Methylobacterium sp. SI9]|uniref:hypothetical protein n=1 Tax=Methylobacterium guangdongense TaxID=3138811 RepID=UPI00313ADA4C
MAAVATVGTPALTICLYLIISKGFPPQQDTGFILGQARAATDILFEAMSAKMQALDAIAAADPDVDNAAYWINPSPSAGVG